MASDAKSVIQRRTEQHFYWMPATCEGFLAAVCAIQDYHKWVGKRGIDLFLTIYCPNPKLEFLVHTLGEHWIIRRDISSLTLEQFDQAVKFDEEEAYKLSVITEKHIVQVFGMMVGSDPVKITPDLSLIVDSVGPENDIAILPFPGSYDVQEFLWNNHPELKVIHLGGQFDWAYAVQGRMLVGVRSGLTYLASAAGRAVVEIYPTDRHRNWISKWGAGMYQMIYGNPGQVQPDLVYRAVEAMWKKVDQRQKAMVVQA